MPDHTWRHRIHKDYKKKKPRKPQIHPDDVAPEDRHKEVIEGEQAVQDADIAEGGYLKDPETEVDTSQPLESKSFEIDPNKIPPTEREKQREDRLRQRAGSGQQGADIAKKKLPKSKQTDLPQFLQVSNDASVRVKTGIAGTVDGSIQPTPDTIDKELEAIDKEAGGINNLDPDIRRRVLTEIGKRILMRGSPQQQMKYAVTVLKYGANFARLILSGVLAGTGISGYR